MGPVLGDCSPALEASTCNVVLTEDPADEEAWRFEARMKHYVYGIPAGRVPMDVLIVGTRDRCESLRGDLVVTVPGGKDTPPTEPCKGPLRFKREMPPKVAR